MVESDGSRFSLESGAYVRAAGLDLSTHSGREITIGIRPEHLEVASPDRADLTLRIAAVETLGADTLVHGSIARTGNEGAQNAGFAARLPGNSRIAEGETLPLRITDGALHVFDRQSEKRIAEI
jgi:sn-glycerol 3-phosphate transport system ATP-binding protein